MNELITELIENSVIRQYSEQRPDNFEFWDWREENSDENYKGVSIKFAR